MVYELGYLNLHNILSRTDQYILKTQLILRYAS